MLIIKFRQGIGLDIEYNEDICHLVEDGDEKSTGLYAYTGAIILLPFLKIYIGDFEELGRVMNND